MGIKTCETCKYYEPYIGVCCNDKSECRSDFMVPESTCNTWVVMPAEEASRIIRERLPKTELLAGLAEEASELAQAALKLRRALDRSNPTPVTAGEALDNLIEELGDVLCCTEAVIAPELEEKVRQVCGCKQARWARRLQAAGTKESTT